MNANVVAASTLAIVGVLVLGVGTFGLSVFAGPRYSLPNAQVQLILDPTCPYNQCTLTQQPTASPPAFLGIADAIGIVESPFVVQSYSVGVGTAVEGCGFGSGTIATPTTVAYPPTYSVLINGQKVGTLPQFFGANTVCGRTGIANFGYNYQPFWLNFTGCGTNGCGTVQFAVGYAPLMSPAPLCYPTGISGGAPTYPGQTPTSVGCPQSQPAASYYAPLATTSTTSTTSTTQTTTQATTATVTTAFTYTAAGTTTTMQVTVTTTQAAPSSAKSSVQALGVGMLVLSGVVLYFGREEEADS